MKYIGARYMPKFMGLHDLTTSYEALSVVDNGMGTTYVSNKPVPAGTPLTDGDYWAVYGASSGAILNLQNQIDDMNDGTVPGSLQNQIDGNDADILALSTKLDKEKFNGALSNDLYYYGSILNKASQGMCVDDNNVIYIATPDTTPMCTITRAALNGSVLDSHSNLQLYHANDMAYVNNRIYVASTRAYDGTPNQNKAIVILDPSSWTTTEIDPFVDEPATCIFGIAKYDNDHLICALTTGQSFSDVALYMLTISTLEYEELTISNPNGLFVSSYSYLQAIEYYNEKLYMLNSAANTVIEFNISDSEAVITHSFTLSGTFNNALPVGETEGIALLKGSYGGIFMINSDVEYGTYVDIKLSLFSPDGNAPVSLIPNNAYFNLGPAADIIADSASTKIMEDGTGNYPFKRLLDAIIVTNNVNDLYTPTGTVRCIAGSYNLPNEIDNLEAHIVSANAGDKLTISGGNYWYNCNVYFNGRSGGSTEADKEIKLSNDMQFEDCNITIINTSVRKLNVFNGSSLKATNLYINDLMWVAGSNAYVEMTGTSIASPTRIIRADSRALVQAVGIAESRIDASATANVLIPGVDTINKVEHPTLTLSGVQSGASYNFSVFGKVCTLSFNGQFTSAANVTLTTIPSGYRPQSVVTFGAHGKNNSQQTTIAVVNSNGTVVIYGTSSTETMYFDVTWIRE